MVFCCLSLQRSSNPFPSHHSPLPPYSPIVHTMIEEDYCLPIGSPGRYSSIRGVKGGEACLISYHWKFDKVDKYGSRQVYYGHIISHKNGQVSIVRPSPKWSILLSKDVMHGWEDATTTYTMSSNYILRSYNYNMSKTKLRDLREAVNPSVQHHLPALPSQEPITWISTASCFNIRNSVKTHTSYGRIYVTALFFLFLAGMYTAGCNVSAVPCVFITVCVGPQQCCIVFNDNMFIFTTDDDKFVPWFEKKTKQHTKSRDVGCLQRRILNRTKSSPNISANKQQVYKKRTSGWSIRQGNSTLLKLETNGWLHGLCVNQTCWKIYYLHTI